MLKLFCEVALMLDGDFEFTSPLSKDSSCNKKKGEIKVWEEQSDPKLSWDPGPISTWKVQVDFMNCNLIIKASWGISVAAYSKKSNCESLKFVIPWLMELKARSNVA